MDQSPSVHVAVNAVTVNSGTARQVLVTPLRTTPPSAGYAVSSNCQPLNSQPSTLVRLA